MFPFIIIFLFLLQYSKLVQVPTQYIVTEYIKFHLFRDIGSEKRTCVRDPRTPFNHLSIKKIIL
jgi:hypothetical protein